MQLVNIYKDSNKVSQFSIGRDSAFGNPYAMANYRNDRNVVVELAKLRFLDQVSGRGPLVKALEQIDAKFNLACFCAPLPCHGDIYLEYLKLFWSFGAEEARKILLEKYDHKSIPSRDGIDHINIYTKSSTKLGRLTSNMSPLSFVHPEHGFFRTMEHFWFWLSRGKDEAVRETESPYEVKQTWGKKPKQRIQRFNEQIEEAIRLKVGQNEGFKEMLRKNTLPFAHYYYYGDIDRCVVRPADEDGLLTGIYTRISHELTPPVRLLVGGSRTFYDYVRLKNEILSLGVNISEIIEGGAKGADLLALEYGKRNRIPVHTEAVSDEEWKKSKGAGIQRNIRMGDMCDQGLVVIVNQSKGSTHMAEYLTKLGKPVKAVHISI